MNRDRVYVGLYASGGTVLHKKGCSWLAKKFIYSPTGDVKISGGITLTVDIDGASPLFILTCVSTGGPATNVIWTRDSTIPVTNGSRTVLVNTTRAEYIHTLNVTEAEGNYTFTVANNKPSSASATREGDAAFIHK